MPRANIYLDVKEDDKIILFSKKWNINKEETIKKIIKDFEERN